MSLFVHPDVFLNGLSVFKSVSLSMSLCNSAPNTLAEASDAQSVGGKRVVDLIAVDGADVSVGDGTEADSKALGISSQQTTGITTVDPASFDGWVAVYDATRLLLVTDEINLIEIQDQSPVAIPKLTLTFNQPVLG